MKTYMIIEVQVKFLLYVLGNAQFVEADNEGFQRVIDNLIYDLSDAIVLVKKEEE